MVALHHASAQVPISGSVKLANGEPLPFANVLLLSPPDSALVAGTMSGPDGHFSLTGNTGHYLLKVSMVGYRPVCLRIVSEDPPGELSVGEIHLSEDAMRLNEVLVTARRPLYEKEPGKTIINVQNSITAAGSTALEVIEKSPGVLVNRQNNSIGMNGKNHVLVMINGKVNRLPMDAVIQMLDGISSAGIEKIELITSPTARHDAEGDAGIIHIVMAESAKMGMSGNFSATLGYARAGSAGGNLNLNRRSGRVNAFLNYSILRDRNKHEWFSEHFAPGQDFVQTNISDSRRKPLTMVQNFQSGIEYNIGDRTSVSILLAAYQRKWDLDAETANIHRIAEDSVRVTRMTVAEVNKWRSASAGITLRHRPDRRQEISGSFDVLYYGNDNPSSYDNSTFVNAGAEPLRETVAVEKVTPVHFHIANLDYTNDLDTALSIAAGAKVTSSRFTNRVAVERTIDGIVDTDPGLTGSSTLEESIVAAYATWRWKPDGEWSVEGGVRYEHTNTYLTTPLEGVVADRSFGNLFPSLFVARGLGDARKIQLAYGRRITRPTFNDMAPFVFYIGPSTFVSGNLSLRPAITDAVDLGYGFRQWWVSLSYSRAKDEIALLQPEYDPETNEQVFRSQNVRRMRTYGASANVPVQLTSWCEVQNEISFYHHSYEPLYEAGRINRHLNRVVFNTTWTIALPSDFTMELSGAYRSASVWGLSLFEPVAQVNLGLRKRLRNEGAITLTFNDILNAMQWRMRTDVPEANTYSYMRYDWGTRSVNLTYSHTFGNARLKAVEFKSGSEPERRRVQ